MKDRNCSFSFNRSVQGRVLIVLLILASHSWEECAGQVTFRRMDFLRHCKRAGETLALGRQPLLLHMDAARFGLRYKGCSVRLRAREGFGVSVLAESLDLNESCAKESIEFHSGHDEGEKRKRGNYFSKTDRLCGSLHERSPFYFYEASSNFLEVFYSQDLALNGRRNSSFSLVVTPVLTGAACGSEPGLFFACRPGHCVARGARCDGHANCGPGGRDEAECQPEGGSGQRGVVASLKVPISLMHFR